ncbi:DUF6440 family protein [Mammaliicoccus sp. H-M34]|uniref:DUF6440 family protein n=1 Tax=Mammaliicoccus sp. H-M34 TaxID=2898693 RepID=UPI001EFAC2EF|nr:DUF6440 family protein [Mammaliicoccus sp. H-M34]
MFGNKNEDERFYVKSKENIKSLGRFTVVVDRETGVNYVHAWVGTGSSLTPLLDKNGNPIIDNME